MFSSVHWGRLVFYYLSLFGEYQQISLSGIKMGLLTG